MEVIRSIAKEKGLNADPASNYLTKPYSFDQAL